MTALATLLWAAAAGLSWRRWRATLEVALEQARALEQGRTVFAAVPPSAEAAELVQGMNAAARRLEQGAAEQQARLLALQAEAHADPVTGLPNRRLLLGRIETATSGALLLLRIRPLDAVNARLGHAGTDALLRLLGAVLQNYPERVDGAFVGRLNGSDFALGLPVPGLARETAESLAAAVRASLATVGPEADVVIGGVDPLPPGPAPGRASAALARADAALARAETQGPFAIEVDAGLATLPIAGDHAWRERIRQALSDPRRCRLQEQPVLAADGSVMHVLCTLELSLGDASDPASNATHLGPHHLDTAIDWVPHAARARLLPLADGVALDLALRASAQDGQPRAVRLSPASLATPGFAGDVTQRLLDASRSSGRIALWLGVPERAALQAEPLGLVEAVAAWRRLGARVGLSQAGGPSDSLVRLAGLGLDHLRVASAYLAGVAGDADVQRFAAGLVAFAHGRGWMILAEGVDSPDDLRGLWSLGFDGAAGPAVSAAD